MKLKQLKEDAFSDELLLDIDFSEFDKVIGFQASKDDKEQEMVDTDPRGVVVDFDDIDGDPSYDDIEEIKEDPIEKDVEDNSIDNDSQEPEIKINELGEGSPALKSTINKNGYKSLAEVYEIRKNFKTNKLVESILCDSVVDCVYDALISTLSSHGITKANAVVILGLMLDRMLKADDSEVVKPDFLKEVLGDLIDGDKEITDIVHDAVQNALTTEPSPKQICTDPELVKIQSNGEEDVLEVKNEEEE